MACWVALRGWFAACLEGYLHETGAHTPSCVLVAFYCLLPACQLYLAKRTPRGCKGGDVAHSSFVSVAVCCLWQLKGVSWNCLSQAHVTCGPCGGCNASHLKRVRQQIPKTAAFVSCGVSTLPRLQQYMERAAFAKLAQGLSSSHSVQEWHTRLCQVGCLVSLVA